MQVSAITKYDPYAFVPDETLRKKPKVLLVDDEIPVLLSFKRILRDAYDIETATSAQEAMRQIEEDDAIKVVVSDMHMPECDGVSFFSKLRRVRPNIKRIILTGDPTSQTAIRAVNDGEVFRFLEKPCSQSDMRTALGAAVEASEQTNRIQIDTAAKIEQELSSPLRSWIEPGALLKTITNRCHHAATKKNMPIELHGIDGFDEIHVDQNLITQALVMLVEGHVHLGNEGAPVALQFSKSDDTDRYMVFRVISSVVDKSVRDAMNTINYDNNDLGPLSSLNTALQFAETVCHLHGGQFCLDYWSLSGIVSEVQLPVSAFRSVFD